MSSSSEIPKKGDIVINPKTQRPIRVGSRTWLGLVKEGVFLGHYRDDNIITESKESPEEVEQQIQNIDRTLPRGEQAVRGRGKYKNKIVKRKTRIKDKDRVKQAAEVASKVVSENIDTLIESGDSFNETLEELIMREMLGDISIPTLERQTTGANYGDTPSLYEPEVYETSNYGTDELPPPTPIVQKRRGRPKGSKNRKINTKSDNLQWEVEEPEVEEPEVEEPIDGGYYEDSEEEEEYL